MFETLPPALLTAVPGPRSRALAERLAAVESRNVTALAPVPPIFWERAAGANVWDADGNRYVDLGAGFGVANVGHAHPRVVEALASQGRSLLHAMGDVHPAAVKVALLEALAARFPGGEPARAVLGSSGSDAVEVALKTALLASGRAGVVAFEGAYHGVTLGGHGWWADRKGSKRHPTIEEGVTLGVGASVLGPVTVGARSRIGPHAVVIDDVPPDSIVVAPKGRLLVERGERVQPGYVDDATLVQPAWLQNHEMGGL